jgi:hypothetical protein
MVVKIPESENLREAEIYKVLTERLSGLQDGSPPADVSLPQFGMAVLKAARNFWVGRSPL